jgi:hypothetical protein
MKSFTTESKTTQAYATQQKPGDKHNEQAVPLITAHNEIVMRAYENVRKWRQKQQCERDWKQAENDLCSVRNA